PFVFSAASKSKLGWDFLAVCDTGRFQDYRPGLGAEGEEFWRQVEQCQYSVREGPGRLMSWGVPDGTRDPQTGALAHDDLLVSAALCALLDGQPWYAGGSALVAGRADPLDEMDTEGF
ncbi:MAG TPA: hypothetical protein VF832_08885, partial [Longimicrobiales bacterium]